MQGSITLDVGKLVLSDHMAIMTFWEPVPSHGPFSYALENSATTSLLSLAEIYKLVVWVILSVVRIDAVFLGTYMPLLHKISSL